MRIAFLLFPLLALAQQPAPNVPWTLQPIYQLVNDYGNTHRYADRNSNSCFKRNAYPDCNGDTELDASIERINLQWWYAVCEWNDVNLWDKLYDNGSGKLHHAKRGIQKRRRHRKDRFGDSF